MEQLSSLLLPQCSSPAPLSGSPAPHRAFTSLAIGEGSWEPTQNPHTLCLTQESCAQSQTCPEPSSAGAAPSWLHLLQPFTHPGTTSPWGRGNNFIYWCISVLQAMPFGQTHRHFSAPPNLGCTAGCGSLFFSLN